MKGNTYSLAITRLQKEYKKLKEKPIDRIFAMPENKNIFQWHFILYNLENDYEGGFYHGLINFPKEYPTKPPSIEFLTPNGRFETNTKVCLSFTNYHPETWSVAWNIESMLVGLLSFMYTNENTAGSIFFGSSSKRKNFAKESYNFNLKNKFFVDNFLPFYHQKTKNIQNNGEKEIKYCEEDKNKNLNDHNDNFDIKDNNDNREEIKNNYPKVLFLGFSLAVVVFSYFYTKKSLDNYNF